MNKKSKIAIASQEYFDSMEDKSYSKFDVFEAGVKWGLGQIQTTDTVESEFKIKIKGNYQYEVFYKSEPNDSIKIDGWFPIATEMIKKPENIEKYITSGILRKIN